MKKVNIVGELTVNLDGTVKAHDVVLAIMMIAHLHIA